MDQEPTLRSRIENASKDLPEEAGIIHRPDGLKHLSPERSTAFLGLVRAGNVLANQLNNRLEAEHTISLRSFEILLFLAVFGQEGGLRMTELTEQAPLSQSRISRLVDALEDRGLVERSPAQTDGRGVTVSITPKGIDRFKAAQESHLADLEELLYSNLSPTEIRQLGSITSKIIEACQPDPK